MWQEYTNGLNLSVLQPVFSLTEQRKKHKEALPKMYQVLTWLKLPSLNFYIPKLALKFIGEMQNVSYLNGEKNVACHKQCNCLGVYCLK